MIPSRSIRRLLSLTVFALVLMQPVWASDDHDHHGEESRHHDVVGTIRAVASNHLELEIEGGKVLSFELTAAAAIKRGDAPAQRDELKAGVKVVVMSEDQNGKAVVVEVNLDAVAHEGHED